MVRRMQSEGKVVTLRFGDNRLARDLFGAEDRHLKSLEKRLGIEVDVRGADLHLRGREPDVATGERILTHLYEMLKKGYPIMGADIERALRLMASDRNADLESLFTESIFLPAQKRVIMPRTPGQKAYIEAIRSHDIVFSIGPAGTGKSYLAVAMAVVSLLRKEYDRIILTRPAVEAGEKLGFLPGDMQEKVNPYLRPLYDALYDILGYEKTAKLLERGIIEVAPIAFMRGRTLNDAFIILDEAQNTTSEQMKMFLTRIGFGSKAVVTGDITQIDLPHGKTSGLREAQQVLAKVAAIRFVLFNERDVVRHTLVQSIITAYEALDREREAAAAVAVGGRGVAGPSGPLQPGR